MRAKISKMIMKIFGWQYVGGFPDAKKAVIIAVPHTSNWDFVWGKLAFLSYQKKATVLMKKEMFIFPLNHLLKSLGVIPVDRGRSGNMVGQLAEEFAKRDSLYISIAPEGSRSKRTNWKKGFYYIALHANVPIYLGEINYEEKTITCGKAFYPTGDMKKDMEQIKRNYINCRPKYPKKFSTGL